MSLFLVQSALEVKLSALSPSLSTAQENLNFVPTTGTPYQQVHFLPNDVLNSEMSHTVRECQGFLFVALMYPILAGRATAQKRADLLADHFRPPQTLTQGGQQVLLERFPSVGKAERDGDRWRLLVKIPWRAYI